MKILFKVETETGSIIHNPAEAAADRRTLGASGRVLFVSAQDRRKTLPCHCDLRRGDTRAAEFAGWHQPHRAPTGAVCSSTVDGRILRTCRLRSDPFILQPRPQCLECQPPPPPFFCTIISSLQLFSIRFDTVTPPPDTSSTPPRIGYASCET